MGNTIMSSAAQGDSHSRSLLMQTSDRRTRVEALPSSAHLASAQPPPMPPTQRSRAIRAQISRWENRIQLIDARCQQALGAGGDAADRGTALSECAARIASRQALEYQLRQATRALDRTSGGQGDICETCGTDIDPARLEAIPQATRCIECQRQHELDIVVKPRYNKQ